MNIYKAVSYTHLFGCTRFVYNYYLDKRKEYYEKDKMCIRDSMYRGWSSTLYITVERRLSMANRVCVLCGAKYDYCPNCDADKGKPISVSYTHLDVYKRQLRR